MVKLTDVSLNVRTLMVVAIAFLDGFLLGMVNFENIHPILCGVFLVMTYAVLLLALELTPEIFKEESLKSEDSEKE